MRWSWWTCWKNLWRASARGRQGPKASSSRGSFSIFIEKLNVDPLLNLKLAKECDEVITNRCLKVFVADPAIFINVHLLQCHVNQVLDNTLYKHSGTFSTLIPSSPSSSWPERLRQFWSKAIISSLAMYPSLLRQHLTCHIGHARLLITRHFISTLY